MWRHRVEHILEDVCLCVQLLHSAPLEQILIPQVALVEKPVEHLHWWRFYFYCSFPQAQGVAIANLGWVENGVLNRVYLVFIEFALMSIYCPVDVI